jgi:CRP-like cAMP-binding protein
MGGMSSTKSANRLLNELPPEEFLIISEFLERVPLEVRDQLECPRRNIDHVYFMESGVASVVAIATDGECLEVAMFGRDGMSGLAVLNGEGCSPHEVFIQVAGMGVRIDAAAFRKLTAERPRMRDLFLLYSQASAVQTAHTALANGRYTINQRLARWLLMCQDRVDGDEFALTHDFLAVMLGVRRPGVTTALHILEGAGIIKSTRGSVRILRRDKLEDQAGGCYGAPEAEYERLIGVPVASDASKHQTA